MYVSGKTCLTDTWIQGEIGEWDQVLHEVGGAWFIRRGKSVATVEWEGLLWYALPAVDSIIFFVLGQQLPFPRIRNVLNYLMTIPVHTDDGESGQVLADSYTSSQN